MGWGLFSALHVWPDGLSYVNERWGGTWDGYTQVSEANYDWGQGLKELARWQQEKGIVRLGVCYYGTDPTLRRLPMQVVPLFHMHLETPEDVPPVVQGKHLAVSISLLNHIADTPGMQQTIAFLGRCWPVDRTLTFLIYDFTRPPDDEGAEESEHGSWPVRQPYPRAFRLFQSCQSFLDVRTAFGVLVGEQPFCYAAVFDKDFTEHCYARGQEVRA